MPDPTTVLTAAALATAAPSPSTLWVPPATPYTLALGSEDGSSDSELAELERRMNRAHALFAAGGTGMVVGGVATAAGASLAIFGAISCIDECNDGLMVAGVGIATAGAATVALSVPVFVTATFLGTEGLRAEGIHVSRVPAWIMLGGLGVVGAGVLVEERSLLTVGAGAFMGGGVAQVIHTRSVFRKYEAAKESGAQAMVLPQWSPEGGAGLSLVVRL